MYNNYNNFAENNVSFALFAQNAVKDYWSRASENFFHGINQLTSDIGEAWKSFSDNDGSSMNRHGASFVNNQMQLATELANNNIQNNISLVSKLESGYNEIYSKRQSK